MPLRKMIMTALFTALLIVATQWAIPIGPVPITMQPFVVMLSGLILGSVWGPISVALWVLLGILGMPVFASGKAGITVLMGPTGGFIIAFIFCSFLIGWFTDKRELRFWPTAAVVIAALLVTYGIGLAGFLFNMQHFLYKTLTVQQGLKFAVLPFIPWDIAKAILAAYVGMKVKNALNQIEQRNSQYKL